MAEAGVELHSSDGIDEVLLFVVCFVVIFLLIRLVVVLGRAFDCTTCPK